MALHKDLPIYKAAYELLKEAVAITKNFPRDFKQSIGRKICDECAEIIDLICEANAALNKAQHIEMLLKRTRSVELFFRLSCDMRIISRGQYAKTIEFTDSIGKQASGWKKQQAVPLDIRPPRQLDLCD